MPNSTTVTITYANGETREFIASDKLEQCINEGQMFSVTTMHSDMSIDEEMQVSKMYVGNPVAAMGNMMMMHRNAQALRPCKKNRAVLEVLTTCINFMKDEITSYQSGMVLPVVEGDADKFFCGHIHRRDNKNTCTHSCNLGNKCIMSDDCEGYVPF